jgi:hypothetical protein
MNEEKDTNLLFVPSAHLLYLFFSHEGSEICSAATGKNRFFYFFRSFLFFPRKRPQRWQRGRKTPPRQNQGVIQRVDDPEEPQQERLPVSTLVKHFKEETYRKERERAVRSSCFHFSEEI